MKKVNLVLIITLFNVVLCLHSFSQIEIKGSGNTSSTVTLITKNSDSDTSMVIRNDGNIGIGTTKPSAKIEINGQIKLTGGIAGLNKILTSNPSGLASWQPLGPGITNYAIYWIGTGTIGSEQYLSIIRGGTNTSATPTQGGIAYGTGSAYAFSSAGAIGQVLTSNGTGIPNWTTVNSGLASINSQPGPAIKIISNNNSISISSSSNTVTLATNFTGSNGSNNSSSRSDHDHNTAYDTRYIKNQSLSSQTANFTISGISYAGIFQAGTTTSYNASLVGWGGSSNSGLYAQSSSNNAVFAQSTSSNTINTTSGSSYPTLYSQNTSSGVVIEGLSTNPSGTSILGIGNNLNTATFAGTGSGGFFNGTFYGVFGTATNSSGQRFCGWMSSTCGSYAYIGGFFSGTSYRVLGSAVCSSTVDKSDGQKVIIFSLETPEFLIIDFGSGKLKNGKWHIDLDPIFVNNIVVNDIYILKVLSS